MKKLILTLLVLCCTFVASAQVAFGVKAGLNIASLMGDDFIGSSVYSTSFGPRIAFNGGLMASIPFTKSMSLQPEAVYSGQGQTLVRGAYAADVTLIYNYLNVPLLFKIQDPWGLFGETGPQVGFLLNTSQKVNGTIRDLSGLQSTDVSWVFGAGFKIPDFPMGFDVRYNLGLTNIDSKSMNPYYAKNSVIQVDVFFLFKTK